MTGAGPRAMDPGYKPSSWPAVLLILAFLDLAFFIAMLKSTSRGISDFASFYAAARIVASHGGASLYSVQTQTDIQAALFPARPTPLLFNHPPYEVLLFLPFSLLPYRAGYFAWCLARLLMLCIAYVLLLRNLDRLRPAAPWLLLGMLAFPAVIDVTIGQDTSLLFLLYALAFDRFMRAKPLPAGFFLGLGLFKFHLVVPFLVPLLHKRRWKVLLGFFLAAVAVLLISVTLVGGEGAWAYVRMLQYQMWHMPESAAASAPNMIPNLRGFLFSTLRGHLGRPVLDGITFIASLLVLLLVFRCAPDSAWQDRDRLPLVFSLACIATLLVSYHSHLYDLALLAIPVFVLAERELPARPTRALLLAAALLGAPLYMIFMYFSQGNLLFLMLLLLGYQFAVALHEPEAPQRSAATAPGAASSAADQSRTLP